MNKVLEEQVDESFAYIEAWIEFSRRLMASRRSNEEIVVELDAGVAYALEELLDLARRVEQVNLFTKEVLHGIRPH